jgi:putative nucleotidyltransferase with HDIG domain
MGENTEHAGASTDLRLADLLAALSVATDLGHGQSPDDAMRACLIATRLAQAIGLAAAQVADSYYCTLLRYVGCTAYAHEEAALFGGDEIDARAAAMTADLGNPREALAFVLFGVGRRAPPLRRVARVAAALPRAAAATKDLAAANCEVGAAMARRLGLGAGVQEALGQVYERWDGKGQPHGLAGDALALPVRLLHIASLAVVFARLGGVDAALAVVRERAGSTLDPAAAEAFRRSGPLLLAEAAAGDPWKAVVAAEPEPRHWIPEGRLDAVARAFADMVDLKLPFTRAHSSEVAALAEAAARGLGQDGSAVALVRRAALFHDLGRVGIPNGVWERRGPLSESDWEQVRLHPYHSERILSRSPLLAPLGRIAGMHHERQDGSGYHRQVAAAGIPVAARVLAAADCYQAMTQPRPHRPALDAEAAARELRAAAGRGRLDGEAVRAVLEAAGHRQPPTRTVWPAGLSQREIEVLRRIARGASYREVARALQITPKTAGHHIEHIYNKIGVSTRAAATLFAMEHDLLTG